MSELKREIRALKDELREMRLVIAALVARAGGELVLTAGDLGRAADSRYQLVVFDEPAGAFSRELVRIRLETTP